MIAKLSAIHNTRLRTSRQKHMGKVTKPREATNVSAPAVWCCLWLLHLRCDYAHAYIYIYVDAYIKNFASTRWNSCNIHTCKHVCLESFCVCIFADTWSCCRALKMRFKISFHGKTVSTVVTPEKIRLKHISCEFLLHKKVSHVAVHAICTEKQECWPWFYPWKCLFRFWCSRICMLCSCAAYRNLDSCCDSHKYLYGWRRALSRIMPTLSCSYSW